LTLKIHLLLAIVPRSTPLAAIALSALRSRRTTLLLSLHHCIHGIRGHRRHLSLLWSPARRHHPALLLRHHHLLHHGWVHATAHHTGHLLRGHITRHHRLHVTKVLLHLEPIRRHLRLAHAVRILPRPRTSSTLTAAIKLVLPIPIVLTTMLITATTALPKFTASRSLLLHISPRLRALDFDLLSMNSKWLA
jgi:hypothetical protein